MNTKDTDEFIKKYPAVIEAVVGILVIAFLIYTMRSLLIFGESTLVHDNILWNYPVFQFFAENIINGHFPLWDPFSHGGEPFYPIIGQMRLFEPVALLVIYLGHFITNDIVMLFNWNRFVQSFVMAFGVYIVLRPWTANLFVRLSLIPILLFSSFFLGSFRQDAILNQFLWVPFITYFLLKIIYYKDYRWHNWLLLAGLIGLNWQSYFFTGTWIFLLFFSVGLILFHRDLLAELFRSRMVAIKFMSMALVIFVMAMPNIVLMLEKDKYVFPARMVDISYEGNVPQGGPVQYEAGTSLTKMQGINMPYSSIALTGTFSNIWDFIQIIAPDGNDFVRWPSRNLWGKPSEAYMYLGFLPWAIALLGLVAGRHDLKRLWLLILLAFGLLMLGPPGGLHRVLYYIYPPMWFVRHTHTFVLFFIFALLYFYILGFNRIFSTWGSQLFPSNSSQGILGRLIFNDKMSGIKKVVDVITRRKEQCLSELQIENNEKNIFRLQGEIKAMEFIVELPEMQDIKTQYFSYAKDIAIFIFSACIVTSVYLMTQLTYPATNFLFGFIIIMVAAGWLLRKDLGERGLYAGLIISHIIIVLIFSTNTYKFIRYIFPVLGLPIALFIFIKTRISFSKGLLRYSSIILLLVFSAALALDLAYSFLKSTFLYQDTEHPAITRDIETAVQKPQLPQKRFIYPEESISSIYDEQGMRYLSLIYRQPFVFSSIMESDYAGSYVQTKGVFKGLKNKSFESWTISSKNKLFSEQFVYHQDGRGGGVERYSGYDGVKDGRFSILLKPSSAGNSYIRYKTSDIKDIRGQYVRASIWVKSQNKSDSAIQVDIQDNMSAPVVKSYNNSGGWEKLTIVKYIDEDTEDLSVTCNIKSFATAPVYFDDLNIEIIEVNTNAFEYALKAKRWSSFLLPKKYFELINSDIPIAAMEEMFAVNKPMFQFKQGYVEVKESEMPSFLNQLGETKSVALLQKSIILDEKVEPALTKLSVSSEEYKKTTPAAVAALKDVNSLLAAKGEGNFTYAIGKYEYNSFDMQISADEDGILYWADGYDKAWHAYVNGKEVPIYRANINFKAIPLPKGMSTIKFIYNPFLFKMGIFVFYGTMTVCFLAATITRKFGSGYQKLQSDKQ